MADILIKNMEMPKNCCYCGFVRLVNTKACCFAVHDNHKDDDVIEYDVTEADLADTTDKMQTKPSWCPLIPVPEHGDLIARGWHIGEPLKNEQGWFLTKVMVRDCDGTFFPEYEACFKYEEWVGRRHRQPVVAYQLIEPTEDSLCEEKK